jgi:hypothetical protein
LRYAHCLEAGLGIESNQGEALQYYKRLADQGNEDAQEDYGRCLAEGIGIEQDEAEAFNYSTTFNHNVIKEVLIRTMTWNLVSRRIPKHEASPTRAADDVRLGVLISGKRLALTLKKDLTLEGLFAKLKQDGSLPPTAEIASVMMKPAGQIPGEQFGKTIEELNLVGRMIELTLVA